MIDDVNTTYKPREIEVADYIFANPYENREAVLSYFCEKCRKNRRTIERWYQKAQEYNKERQQKQENIRDEILTEQTKEAIKSNIISRNESLEILSAIAKGIERKVGEEIFIPTDSERTRAIQQLAKMEGWEAPVKTENKTEIAYKEIEVTLEL